MRHRPRRRHRLQRSIGRKAGNSENQAQQSKIEADKLGTDRNARRSPSARKIRDEPTGNLYHIKARLSQRIFDSLSFLAERENKRNKDSMKANNNLPFENIFFE